MLSYLGARRLRSLYNLYASVGDVTECKQQLDP